jgi:adenine-specific DNA-methyltransferase
MLRVSGIMAFIVPKSFLNSAYYSKIRDFIKSTCSILEIVDFENQGGFLDTQQVTFGLILQKTTSIPELHSHECSFSMKLGDHFVFSESAQKLRELLVGSTTLKNLGFYVKTGTIVWNEHKPELTRDASHCLLVYNSNIIRNNLLQICEFSNNEKKQYIRLDGSRDRILVVNRGNGNAAYKLSYSLLGGAGGREYLVENHLNMICSDTKIGDELEALYKIIIASFENAKTQEFIKIFLGNNGLSKTELETVFPIYVS